MDVPSDEEPTAVPGCVDALSTHICLHFSLIPAVLIVGVLSFLQKRKKKHAIDQRCPFLQGRFGIVIPMDVMSFSNRWSYGFAFGAIAYSVLELFYEQHMPKIFPPWAKAIAFLIGAFEVGLAYFPFFACLSTPFRAAGGVLGLLYSIGWIFIVGWDWFTCPGGEVWGQYEKLIYQWPWMLSLIFLLGRFAFLFVRAVYQQSKAEQEDGEEVTYAHLTAHVKRLLKRPAPSKPQSWFERNIYDWDPHFKFPNRLIGSAIISLLSLYVLILADIGVISLIFNILEALFFPTNPAYAFQGAESVKEHLNVGKTCAHLTVVTAALNIVIFVCHVLVRYRKQIKRLWKGQKDFLPKKLQNPSSAISVASIAKFSSWQIAFTLWGFIIVRIVQLCFALIIAYVLVLPIKNGDGWIMLEKLGLLLVTFGVGFVLFKLQVLLVQYLFLQDKMSDTDKEKPLALNNRNAFNCFNYFFFFYNVVLGVGGCLFRMMISFVLGTWLVSRIDRTIMPKGYETLDKGYRTWIGMLFAEHYHSNPVMVCFCQLLLSHFQQKHDSHSSLLNHAPCNSVSRRVMKRWRLYYTLLKNPQLIPLRKQHLSAEVPLTVSSPAQADIVVRAWLMRSQAAAEMTTEQS